MRQNLRNSFGVSREKRSIFRQNTTEFLKKRMLNLMFESKNKGQKKIKRLFFDTYCRYQQETVGLNDVRFLAKRLILVR